MSASRSSRLLAAFVIVLVGLAGVAIGAAIDRTMEHRRMMDYAVGGRFPKGPPPEARKWVLSKLERELGLSAVQRDQVDSVLSRREADVKSLMVEMRPRFEAISVRTRRDIQSALTPEQQQHFSRMSKEAGSHGSAIGAPSESLPPGTDR